MNLKIMLVDLDKRDISVSRIIRAEQGWTMKILKNFIGEVQ